MITRMRNGLVAIGVVAAVSATVVAQAVRPAFVAPGVMQGFMPALATASQTTGSNVPAKTASKAGWTPPRTAWGDPDLTGTYTSDDSIGIPFERPPQYAGRAVLSEDEFAARERANAEQLAKDRAERPESSFEEDAAANNAPRHWLERASKPSRATSLVVEPADGRIPPMTPEAQQRIAERRAARLAHGASDSYEYHSNYDRCISRGVTSSMLPAIYGNGTNIMQGPGYVVIRNEMIHEARVVPLDAHPHVGKNIRTYMGDPRGHWEGNTLVVESTNFADKTAIGGGAIPTDSLRLVERFTRTGADAIQYEFTVDDPRTYARPWKVALELRSRPGYEIYEYACHEGNYGLANMLSAARADERK